MVVAAVWIYNYYHSIPEPEVGSEASGEASPEPHVDKGYASEKSMDYKLEATEDKDSGGTPTQMDG